MKTFLLLFGLAGAAVSMYATPILYTFNFTGGSPNPSGSFDYDSSTNTFSNVMLTWDGVQQPSNWTTVFNQSGGNFCGVSAPAAFFQGLTQGACGGVTWNARNGSGGSGLEDFDLLFTFNGISGWNNDPTALSSAPIITTSGTVSASAATPEPGTVGLCIAGAALLAWKRRQRGISGAS